MTDDWYDMPVYCTDCGHYVDRENWDYVIDCCKDCADWSEDETEGGSEC